MFPSRITRSSEAHKHTLVMRLCLCACLLGLIVQQSVLNYPSVAHGREISDFRDGIIISGIKGPPHHFPLQQMKRQTGRLRIQSGDRNTHTRTQKHTGLSGVFIPRVWDQSWTSWDVLMIYKSSYSISRSADAFFFFFFCHSQRVASHMSHTNTHTHLCFKLLQI